MKNEFRIVTFDLESSGLKANDATILCGVIKELKKKEIIISNKRLDKDRINDKEVVCAIRDELNKADLIVGFYHLNFDMKILNTKLLGYGEKMTDKKLHIDLYRVAKTVFNTSRRNLDTISKFLGIKQQKTHIDWSAWREAAINGNEKALKKIIWHCILDVRITEEVFLRLKGLIRCVSLA